MVLPGRLLAAPDWPRRPEQVEADLSRLQELRYGNRAHHEYRLDLLDSACVFREQPAKRAGNSKEEPGRYAVHPLMVCDRDFSSPQPDKLRVGRSESFQGLAVGITVEGFEVLIIKEHLFDDCVKISPLERINEHFRSKDTPVHSIGNFSHSLDAQATPLPAK